MASVKLYGRIFLTLDIHTNTGLRIGGSPSALQIGGLDNIVIRDTISQKPYIPGSSIRGKLRSLWEKATNAEQNAFIRPGNNPVRIHKLGANGPLNADPVCRIFGVTGDTPGTNNPTRLIVHDTFMSADSARQLEEARTDQPYTETKWEAVIDRITSAAVPRPMERVPAGTTFSGCQLIYSIYGDDSGNFSDVAWFFDVIQMLQLLEDDYLGSGGSRGSGSVSFYNMRLGLRVTGDYLQEPSRYMTMRPVGNPPYDNLDALWQASTGLHTAILEHLS